jgi:hypothetical protein
MQLLLVLFDGFVADQVEGPGDILIFGCLLLAGAGAWAGLGGSGF